MENSKLKSYQKLSTEFYDFELDFATNTKLSLNFYMQYANQANGPILEPMCGTGRFLIPMLNSGLDIEGFDASKHMLDALNEKYKASSKTDAPVWCQFIENFQTTKLYNLIFIPFGSLGLITDIEKVQKSLRNMYESLSPKGKLLLEIETPASLPDNLDQWCYAEHIRDDQSKIVLHSFPTYDANTQIFSVKCRYESLVNNQIVDIENEDFQQYIYNFNEMDQLLEKAGFSQIKKYKNYSKEIALDQDTPNIIYECTK